MKKSLKCMLFAAAFVVGETVFSNPFSLFATEYVPIKISIPSTSLDLSDLDLRDEQNRRIASPSLRAKMRGLFTNRLNQLLLFNLTPSQQRIQGMMARVWDVISGWWKAAASNWFQEFSAWINRKEIVKKFTSISWLVTDNNQKSLETQRIRLDEEPSLFLLSSIISSTILLR